MIRSCRLTDGSEIVLLGVIAVGVMILCGVAIQNDRAAEASAWTAVLMAIINVIKERSTQRSVDRMGDQLATSSPRGTDPLPVTVQNPEGDPVPVKPTDS